MNELFDNSVDWVYAHPRYGYLIAGVLLLFWLFGVIRGWKWTYKSRGSWGENTIREIFGERGWRFCVGALLVVALAASLYLFFSADK